MKPEPLESTLQSAEALIESEVCTMEEIGAALMPGREFDLQYPRLREWIFTRKKSPNGETAVKLHIFVTAKLKILKGAKETAYLASLKEIRQMRG